MASQIQRVEYEGYLVADPEMRFTPSGQAVTNFRIGSNREWKNQAGEKQKETTWLKVTAWGNLAEIVNNYCKKGYHVIVFGRLKPDANGNPSTFQRNDGTTGSSFELTAQEVRILTTLTDTSPGDPSPAEQNGDLPY